MTRPSFRSVKREDGYRSGLEAKIAQQLVAAGIAPAYETVRIKYTVPSREATYTPDFLLPNGIYIECKGIWEAADRQKHVLVREQHPELDIRLVFSRSASPIYKGSPTSYAEWCRQRGILFADKLIPIVWLKEKPRKPSSKE